MKKYMKGFTTEDIEYSAILTAIWYITGSSTPSDIPHKKTAEFWGQYAVKESDIDSFIATSMPQEDEPQVIDQIRHKLSSYVGRVHGAPGEFLRRAPVTGNIMFRPPVPEDEIEPSVVKFAKSEYERLSKLFDNQGPEYETILQEINNIYYDPLQVLLMTVVKDKKKSLGITLSTMEQYDPSLSLLHNAIIGHTSYPVWIPRIELIYNEYDKKYLFRNIYSYIPDCYLCMNTNAFHGKTMATLCYILKELIGRLNPSVELNLVPYLASELEYFDISLKEGVLTLADINYESVSINSKS